MSHCHCIFKSKLALYQTKHAACLCNYFICSNIILKYNITTTAAMELYNFILELYTKTVFKYYTTTLYKDSLHRTVFEDSHHRTAYPF